ncbi:deaminase [Herbaspirillum sp. WKF16]|uniref:deaminase n=1 Tax=Herbaspirillum sp. WKF16 TaxID=3028312 RepID=UPI0023A96F34|nr:deaminase [Herbaspirillum sp. WKF16]WDZ97336.1 deaminase [Herbaspirillum sp. WKF16]
MTEKPNDRLFMAAAVEEMRKSDAQVKVGAVIVVDGQIVASACRTKNEHAERAAIRLATERGVKIKNATLYATLEPCVELRPGQQVPCCADLVVSSGIKEVVIGRYDPNPNVCRQGWKRLRDGHVYLRDFHQDFREEIDGINSRFVGFFEKGMGPTGGAKVGHKDKGIFLVQFSEDDDRTMEIAWTVAGIDAAYGFASRPVEVAMARFANAFDEVDDPTAYDFRHSVRIGVGEIGIFKGPSACVLVKPKEIHSGPEYGNTDFFVNFEYQVRITKPR